eukprot:671311-Pelagomonas_calceolata.AAC.1
MKNALDKDGTQSHVLGRATPADLYARLTKGGVKAWSDRFTAKIKPECGGLCVLECKACKANLSPANPAETRKRHNCTKAALQAIAAAVAAAAAAAEAAQSRSEGSSSRKQAREEQEQEVEEVDCIGQPKTMTALSVSPSQVKQSHRLFAMHIIKEEHSWAVPCLKERKM